MVAPVASATSFYGSALGASLGSLAAQQVQQAYQPGKAIQVNSINDWNSNYLTLDSTSTSATTSAIISTTNPYAWYTYSNGIGFQQVQQTAEKVVKKALSFRDELRSEIDAWLEPSLA